MMLLTNETGKNKVFGRDPLNKNIFTRLITHLLYSVLLLTVCVQSSLAVELFSTNANVNFKPITFKVDVPGGVNYVKWLNAPANLADAYKLETRDGVTYKLNGFAAYRTILDDNITTLQFLITSNAGLTTTLNVPVNIITDPAPQAIFADTTSLTLYKGQQTKLPVQLSDAGRNITRITAVIAGAGSLPDNSSITLGTIEKELFLGYDYATDFYRESYEATGPVRSDTLDISLAISVSQYTNTGNYDLYLRATDSKGNVTYSSPRSLTIAGPLIPPSLTVQVPAYRIPPGQPYPIKYQANHLESLDRIEISQSGSSGTSFNAVVSLNNVYSASGTTYATIPPTANVDDSYNLSVTLYDVKGKSTTTLATVSVGGWGERTVSVSNTVMTNVDESFNFANVTVTAGSSLRHLDSNIKFNNLIIEAGAVFASQTPALDINGALVVNGDLYSATIYNYALTSQGYTGGGHGGNGRSGRAYGSFRNPQFPGAQGASNSHYYPVDLNITATDITVNGSIRADGTVNSIAPGGLLTINSNTLAIKGSISANANRYAAGGTVNITTPALSGTGTISANGGNDTYNGAGGRIAIHYSSYGNGSIPLNQGLILSSYPGIATSTNTNVGAGTIFLKRNDQLYGELYIDNGGRAAGNTSLRSVGRHTIQSIVVEAGTTDQYRVTVDGSLWSLPTPNSWNLGLKELSVSLDANNRAAPLYPITQLVVPTTGINLQETRTLAAAGTPGSVQFHRFSLTDTQVIKFTTTAANFTPHMYLFNDTGAITASDARYNVYGSGATFTFSLTPGNYLVAVGSYYLNSTDAAAGVSNTTCNNCSYTLSATQVNTNSFLVQSATDITSNAGNDLIGVIRLDTFSAGTGTRVISSDRIHSTNFKLIENASVAAVADLYSETVNNIANTVLTTESKVFIGDVNANNLTLDASILKVYGALNVAGNLTVQNTTATPYESSLVATGLAATGSLNIQDTALSISIPGTLTIGGGLNLTSVTQPTVLTVPDATNQQVHKLLLNVQGAVQIDANASIDLVGKGNELRQYTGLDDFINPQFAAPGDYAPGGGLLNLVAGSIQLDGKILVDGGVPTFSNRTGGWGGSVAINTPVFNGNGSITANAGFSPNATYLSYSGDGGLISVVAQLDNFSVNGQYSAIGGRITTGLLNEQGAAGTVYLRTDTTQPGHLIVDNTRATVAQPTERSTVLRSVGYQTISAIDALGNNDWRITVNGTPWIASTINGTGIGLAGLTVDLDASDEAGTLYTITSNTPNSFILNTIDDLSSYLNSSLIGVTTINQLTVKGVSQLYTGDRLVITTPAASVLDSGSKIIVGQLNNLALSYFQSAANIGTIELINPLVITDFNISNGRYIFSGGLSVTNSLVIGASASVSADSLTTNTISVNGGTLNSLTINVSDITMTGGILITENVNASGNILLANSAIMTVPDPTDTRFYALNLNVAGQLNLETGSIIDLNGKGYTGNYQSGISFNRYQNWLINGGASCHGGRSTTANNIAISSNNIATFGKYELCSYGSYAHARYPGIAISSYQPGGGYARLVANDFLLNGTVRANAIQLQKTSNYNNSEGASGGGIHIEVATLSGAGAIETRGGENTGNFLGNYFYTGPGGRISVYYSASNTFSGSYDAGSGNAEAANSNGATGGSGTIYLQDLAQNQGQLIIDNYNRVDSITTPRYTDVPTALRSVGRHTISAIDSLGAGLWRVHINSSKLDNITQTGTLVTPQTVNYHNFTLNTAQNLAITLSNFGYEKTAYLFNDDGNLDSTDFISSTRSNYFTVSSLPAGNYIVAVASGFATLNEMIQGNNADNTIHNATDGISIDTTGSISYNLNINPTKDSTWRQAPEQSIAGHRVSLDAANAASNLYSIVSNTAETFVIDTQSTTLDLSTVVGNDLIGVHVLDILNVRGKSVLDVGPDRLTLLQPLLSSVEAGSTLIVGEIDAATIESLFTTSAGKIVVNNNLALNTMSLTNTEVEVQGQLTINTNLVIDGGILTASDINVGNNLDIINGGILTVPDTFSTTTDTSLNKIHKLQLNVTGAINIDTASSINLDGKGYPGGYNGPDYSQSINPDYGCSGGISGYPNAFDCTYGRYNKARFAGSGGRYTGNTGGGIVSITANSLSNNGLVSANGVGINNGGAGGAIHIQVATLSGNGTIQTNSAQSAGAGRISVQVATTDSFTTTGTYSAISNVYGTRVGGAGTVYINSPDYPNGYLKIDNNGNASLPNSTPVRSVGKHTIVSATRPDATHIEITVAGTPGWKASDPLLDWGLDGLAVDLDASDQAGPLYPVTTNTTSTLTIDDSAAPITNLATLINLELIGTHTFDRLQVSNGASIDFGADRVIINNAVAMDFVNAVHIRLGELNQAALDIILSQLGDTTTLEMQGNLSATTLNMVSGNVTVEGDLAVAANLTLSDTANMQVDGKLTVAGDIALAANATLTTLDATATNVLIDGGTMVASLLKVANDITILSTTATGVLTAPFATLNPNIIYPLDVTAGNNIIVNTGSFIDVNGKGYPALEYSGGPDFNYWNSVSCHAGKVSSAMTGMNCQTYGRLEKARFAGSAGRYNSDTQKGNGGGVIRITAPSLNNTGTIRADGDIGYYGGAGGSIHLELSSLQGTGLITTNGGGIPGVSTVYRTGGGGRISINLPDRFANGIDLANVQARGGASTYSNAGAGTVFLKYANETQGHLIVDNGGVTASTFSTPVREVGRYTITSATPTGTSNTQGESLYELVIAPVDAVHIKTSGTVNAALPGTVLHHNFSLVSARTVNIEITESEFNTQIHLFQNVAGTLNYITTDYSSSRGYQSRIANWSLQAGDYVVAVSGQYTSTADAMNQSKTSNSNFGSYKLSIDTLYDVPGDTWHASDAVYGWGLDGLKITLDPTTPAAALYTIDSNTGYSLIVASPVLDLSSAITTGVTELMGVHEFETITLRNGAQVDFGVDRVMVSRPLESIIDASSTLTADPASVLP